jgi:hypothetical protein
MRYIYCHRWNDWLWQPRQPLREKQARARFNGEVPDPNDWFSVVAFGDGMPDSGVPDYVLEVLPHAAYINVFFYDMTHNLRFIYGFEKTEGRMFLSELTEYTYPDDGKRYTQGDCTIVESFIYRPDGYVRSRLDDNARPTIEVTEYRDVDVSAHWEDIPEFGNWEPFGRHYRWAKPGAARS